MQGWAATSSFEEVRLNALWAEYGSEEETAAVRVLVGAAADELPGGETVEALWAGAKTWRLPLDCRNHPSKC